MPRMLITLLLLSLIGAEALAQDIIIVPPKGRRPAWRAVDIRASKVTATIKDQAATVHVKTTFHNPNTFPAEGTYVMSLPAAASVSDFTMTAAGKTMEAKLVPADEARAIYASFVRRSIDPGLLELVGTQMLRARVSPIPPDQTLVIETTYQYLLPEVNGVRRLVLPLARHRSKASPIKTASVLIDLVCADPIKNIYSPTHSVDIARRDDRNCRISYEGSDLADRHDLLLYYSVSPKEIGLSLLTFRRKGEDGTFALLASPRVEVPEDQILPKDIVFVFDRSGSMRGEKIRQVKAALRLCIGKLNPEDRFNIVAFSTENVFYSKQLVAADETGRNRSIRYIENIRASGGTHIESGLRLALKQFAPGPDRVKMIFFATDGIPTLGERNHEKLIDKIREANKANVRLFVFGVGTDVNTFLLDRLAEDGRGARDYVMPDEDIAVKVVALYAKTSAPILTDVKLSFGTMRVEEIYPKKIHQIFRGDQLALFGRFRGTGPATITLRGMARGEERTFSIDVVLAEQQTDLSPLPRLWASRKVAFLADQMRLHGTQDPELVDEIVRLAKEYGIITPYTSFLITEDGLTDEKSVARFRKGMEEMERRARDSGGRNSGAPATAARESGELKKAKEDNAADRHAEAAQRALKQAGKSRVRSIRYVGTKTFLLIDTMWTDSEYKKDPKEKIEEIEFLSDAYFKLVKDVPDLAAYFALGESVVVVHGGKTFRVTPPAR